MFPGWKHIDAWKKTLIFNHKPKLCQNAALLLNGMYQNIPSTECWTLCRAASSSGKAWVGNAYARSPAPLAILSISGNDDTASPHQSFQGMVYDCTTHSVVWYLNFIATPPFVCPKMTCIELPISLLNDRHVFADSFVTMGPIAMKFGWA